MDNFQSHLEQALNRQAKVRQEPKPIFTDVSHDLYEQLRVNRLISMGTIRMAEVGMITTY